MHYNPNDWLEEPRTKDDFSRITHNFDIEINEMADFARQTKQNQYREKASELQRLKEQWLNMYDHLYHNLPD